MPARKIEFIFDSVPMRCKPFNSFLLLIWLALTIGCTRRQHHAVSPAFYSWKTVYAPVDAEVKAQQALNVRKIYLRCFDVDWNDAARKAAPVAAVRLPAKMDGAAEYVPVVFITQRAMVEVGRNGIDELAVSIAHLLTGICGNSGIAPKEIQIDCDWTAGSREAYFSLLEMLRQQGFFNGRILSCTIRLHQVKYKDKSGIPPADRGMLMLYNIGNLKQATAHNSILEATLAKDYMAHLSVYPLPLDVALPLFSWCTLFRKGVFAGIIRDADPAELKPPLFRKMNGNLFTVLSDTMWHGYGLKADDVIRAESPSMADLREVAEFSAARLKPGPVSIAFFGADSIALSHYSTHEIQTLLDAYR